MADTLTISKALHQSEQLKAVSDTPRLDVELLLSEASGYDRTYFYTWPEKELTPEVQSAFLNMLARRQKGEPIAHITGQREFWSLPLKVNASTLIPRPDTEVLVETALAYLPQNAKNMIDLGTGTGAIALAIASERPDLNVIATDQSADAVALAKANALALNVRNVDCLQASWLDKGWCDALESNAFDMIVSNPPYIDEKDEHLDQGDVRFEPRSALVASENGLSDIRHIALLAKRILKPRGFLWLEHGWQQAQAVADIVQTLGFESVKTMNDYGGNPRVTGGQKHVG